jgi:hypothetical protein
MSLEDLYLSQFDHSAFVNMIDNHIFAMIDPEGDLLIDKEFSLVVECTLNLLPSNKNTEIRQRQYHFP